MRPLKLKVRGFLTYKNEIEIDFTRLYEKKIFLIAGDTGSGKTSIFDAITYALYGEVARDIDQTSLRSDFLNESDPYTYVDLVFEVDGKLYQIERIPNQIAQKSKPGQNIKTSVTLYDITYEKKIISEKKTQTDKKLVEIIGLDKNQFTKVMLLAQGEFQEFLQAKSDDRTKLLGNIFKTYEYKEIQEKIKEKARLKSKDMEIIDERLETIIYQYPYIAEKVDRDHILVHDFTNVLSSIDEYQKALTRDFNEINNKETSLEDKEKEAIGKKEKAKTLNANIQRYFDINDQKTKLLSVEDIYKEKKSKLEKSEFAKSIKIYEDRYKKAGLDGNKAKDNLQIYLKYLEEINQELYELQSSYDNIADKQENVNNLKLDLKDLIDLLERFQNFVVNKKSYLKIQENEEALKEKKKDLDQISSEIDKLNDSLNIKNDEEAKLRDEIYRLKESLMELNHEKTILEDKIVLKNKNIEINEKILANKKALEDLHLEKIDINNKITEYYLNQRLIDLNKFIDELNDTNICPVCGHRHEDKFEKHHTAEIDINQINKNLYEINSKIASLESQNYIYNKSLVEIEDDANILADFEKLKDNIKRIDSEISTNNEKLTEIISKKSLDRENLSKANEKANELKRQLEAIDKIISDGELVKAAYLSEKDKFEDINIDDLGKRIEKIKREIKALDEDILNTTRSYNNLLTRKAEITTNISNSQNLIGQYEREEKEFFDEFEKKVAENFEDKASYLKALEEYQTIYPKKTEIENHFKELEKINTLYENYKVYKDENPVDIEKIEEEILALSQRLKSLREDKSNLQVKITNVKNTYDNLSDLEKSYKEISAESQILQNLSKIADGSFAKVAGREKIDFETFVLTYYFDKVLAYANRRLYAMSNGQFSLIRKSYGDDLRMKQGLDIEILDANTGKKRPASTLSGGESFLASLSLALGLSDEIAAENGGIKIDTLFIDEGFGTLSEDYLNKVIEQIEKLSYENKFIGLISHVGELKDAIDAKIIVTYTSDEGSFIEVKPW